MKHEVMTAAPAWNADLQGAMGLTADQKGQIPGQEAKAGRAKRPARSPDLHVANALRSAYEQAVSEDVPREFLDLLGKLA